jgi:phage gp36-like protein
MPYANQDDLVARYGAEELMQLTDYAGAGIIDAAAVATALADAQATIDGYLGGVYAVPVSPTPPMLARLACEVARYQLHGKAADDTVRRAYEDALRTLRDLSTGTAVLIGAAAAPANAAPAVPQAGAMVAGGRALPAGSLQDFLG